MAYGASSGTVAYNPFGSDLILDALERCGIYNPEPKHFTSARRSANLILVSDYSNRGINLWKIDESPTVIYLPPGIATFDLTSDVVGVFDTYRRQYQMNGPQNVTPNFSTTINSNLVTIGLANNGLSVGNYVGITTQIAVGGVILYGFYPVLSTPSTSTFTIAASSKATSSVVSGGAVPQYTTINGSDIVTVTLAAHGYLAGEPFVAGISTTVGGVTLYGSYPILTTPTANTFTIQAANNANASTSAYENGGLAQISTQNPTAPYTDILLTPWSRTDYASQSNKAASGAPTSYWVNRQITPQVTIWPVTDTTGPYEFRSYMMRQVQDFGGSGGETTDLPSRMFYAFTADLARDLAIKFAPQKYAMLKAESDAAWDRASGSDVENVTTSILPNFSRVC